MLQATTNIAIHLFLTGMRGIHRIVFPAVLILAMIPLTLSAQQTSKKLRLLSPVGGETFKPGDTVTIRWGGTGNQFNGEREDTVRLELSTDGGQSWNAVADVGIYTARPTPRYDSSYRWVVPSVSCTECLLQIRQVKGFIGSGDSIGSFRVTEPGRRLEPYDGYMEAVFSKGDSLLAIKTKDSIVLWDVAQRIPVRTFLNPSSKVYFNEIRFTRDDTFLIVGASVFKSFDTAWVFVWNIKTGELLHAIQQRSGLAGGDAIGLGSGSLSPDGTQLLTTGGFQAQIWDVTGSNAFETIIIADQSISGDFSPDGKTVAIGSRGKFGVWDVETRQNIYQSQIPAHYVEYSEDGASILLSSSSFVNIVEASTGKGIYGRSARPATMARFARYADRLVLSADLSVADFGQNTVYKFKSPDTASYTRTALTPYGGMAAVVSMTGKVDLWDLTGIPVDTIDAPFSIDASMSVDAEDLADRGVAGKSVRSLAVSVRPNPAIDAVTISCRTSERNSLELTLFDMTGRVLDRIDLGSKEPGVYNIAYDVGNLPSGVYRFKVRGGQRADGQTVIVAH